MKTIIVEVSDAQHEFLTEAAGSLHRVTPGDLLLACAFGELSTEVEMKLDGITAYLREFVSLRKIPEVHAALCCLVVDAVSEEEYRRQLEEIAAAMKQPRRAS